MAQRRGFRMTRHKSVRNPITFTLTFNNGHAVLHIASSNQSMHYEMPLTDWRDLNSEAELESAKLRAVNRPLIT